MRDICSDENDQKIVRTLISMAHSMQMTVVAEGVEDREQFDLLRDYGVDEIQGYLLSKPVEAAAIEALVQAPQTPLSKTGKIVQIRS